MPARLDLSAEEMLARVREQNRERVKRYRARRSVTNNEGNVTKAVRVTSPTPSPSPEVSPPQVPPQTPPPSLPLPPLSTPPTPSPLPLAKRNGNGLLLVDAPEKPRPIEEVLAELFGQPGTPRERSTRQAAANQFKAGARDAGISLAAQADRIRLAYTRYCETFDSVVTPHALVNHFGELTSDQHRRRPTRVRREVVQRLYQSHRVERSVAQVFDDAAREAGG